MDAVNMISTLRAEAEHAKARFIETRAKLAATLADENVALGWHNMAEVFEAQGRHAMYSWMKGINDEVTEEEAEQVLSMLRRAAIQRVTRTRASGSTSALSNAADAYEIDAWASLLERLI